MNEKQLDDLRAVALEHGAVVIEATPPATCELCGAFEELRPYGPNYEAICFECGQKNVKLTGERIAERLNGGSMKPK